MVEMVEKSEQKSALNIRVISKVYTRWASACLPRSAHTSPREGGGFNKPPGLLEDLRRERFTGTDYGNGPIYANGPIYGNGFCRFTGTVYGNAFTGTDRNEI